MIAAPDLMDALRRGGLLDEPLLAVRCGPGAVTLFEPPTPEAFAAASLAWLTGGADEPGVPVSGINPAVRRAARTSPIAWPPRRRAVERKAAEFLRAADVARILPLSERQIQSMAARGELPARKLPGCDVWLFDEAEIRALVASPAPEKASPCRRSPARKTPTATTTSTSAAASTTSATCSAGSPPSSRLERLMSARRGGGATKS